MIFINMWLIMALIAPGLGFGYLTREERPPLGISLIAAPVVLVIVIGMIVSNLEGVSSEQYFWRKPK